MHYPRTDASRGEARPSSAAAGNSAACSYAHATVTFGSRLAERATIYALRDRLGDSQHAVPSSPRPLSDPLCNSWFVLNKLAYELAGEPPHRRQFIDRIVPLGEGLDDFVLFGGHRAHLGTTNCCRVPLGRLLEPAPQPLLQRVETNENGICGRQSVRLSFTARTLPGEFRCINQDQSRRSFRSTGVQRRRVHSEGENVDQRPFVKSERRRSVECRPCCGDERVVKARLATDGHLNAGYIGDIRHTNPTNVNGSDAGRICRDIA